MFGQTIPPSRSPTKKRRTASARATLNHVSEAQRSEQEGDIREAAT
jgi:hypothetical protein